MKTILWVSRHAMTPRQFAQLQDIYGEIHITQLDNTLSDVSAILDVPADVYAVVLPLSLLASLRQRTDKEIIQSVSGRIPTGRTIVNPANGAEEQEYVFDHIYWQRILRLELETEIIEPNAGSSADESIIIV